MIYICCPAKYATGGTELLHQLYFQLSKKTKNVRMYYWGNAADLISPIAERFTKYQVEYSKDIQDAAENCIIVPEIYVDYLKKFNKTKKIIWWLSIDNFYLHNSIRKNYDDVKGRLKANILFIYKYLWILNPGIIHLVQSMYALKHLRYRGIKSYLLSDYLGEDFLQYDIDYSSKNRENIVLYNPQKGIKFTKKIINHTPDLNFVPLENMTVEQIVQTCKNAKVYIDFGAHPGKDRFPREAAILGCIIITGKKGSAKYKKDIYIPDEYKFSDKENKIPDIVAQIKSSMENYDIKIDHFKDYRDLIKKEKTGFLKQLDSVWKHFLIKKSL
jgi:hypothetical protein